MSLIKHKLAAATAVAAAFSLAATPGWAAELPRVAGQGQAHDAHALDVQGHGHRGGRHGGHRGHDDDWDIDGDDVLAGVLILGGLAAIAGIAGSGKNRQQSYPEPAPYPEDADYQAPAPAPEARYRSGDMSGAVDTCVAEIEAQRGPIGSVDSASRAGDGWYVAGELEDGTRYSCRIDGAGRVIGLEPGDYGASYEAPAKSVDDGYLTLQKQAADDDGYAMAQAGE